MTPRGALDRIAALCDQAETNRWNYPHDNGLSPLATYKLRAVLAEVSPEPGGVLDRDQARAVLDLWAGGRIQYGEGLLDRLAGCVRPAAIDRDALERVLLDYFEAKIAMPLIRDRVLALVRPAPAGVTLNPEEAALLLDGEHVWPHGAAPVLERLRAARLEAAS